MAANESFDRRLFDRQMFLWAAIFFLILVFAGFAQTYYLKPFLASVPLRTLTHLHGIVMTAWVLFFVMQIYLIRSKSVALHMRMGWVGIGLAVVVIGVGLATGIQAAKNGIAPAGIDPIAFLIIPLGDMLIFAVLFGFAIYYRKNAANHKRLLLLTAFNFLPPAVGRLPFAPLELLGPLWFFGVPDVLLLITLGIDTWKNGRLNRAFAFGAALLILSHILRLSFMSSGTWMSFATWITS